MKIMLIVDLFQVINKTIDYYEKRGEKKWYCELLSTSLGDHHYREKLWRLQKVTKDIHSGSLLSRKRVEIYFKSSVCRFYSRKLKTTSTSRLCWIGGYWSLMLFLETCCKESYVLLNNIVCKLLIYSSTRIFHHSNCIYHQMACIFILYLMQYFSSSLLC